MPLNDRQKRFCEFYIANGGNATKAAKDAGYSAKTAHATGNENLKKPEIQKYIKSLSEPAEKSRIASASEVLSIITAIARRVPDDDGARPKYGDALKAAELLGRNLMLWDGSGKEKGSNGILESLLKRMEAAENGN